MKNWQILSCRGIITRWNRIPKNQPFSNHFSPFLCVSSHFFSRLNLHFHPGHASGFPENFGAVVLSPALSEFRQCLLRLLMIRKWGFFTWRKWGKTCDFWGFYWGASRSLMRRAYPSYPSPLRTRSWSFGCRVPRWLVTITRVVGAWWVRLAYSRGYD